MVEDTTTISEVETGLIIIEVEEEVDIIVEVEEVTTITKAEVDLTTIFPMGIQVKTTKQLNASFSNLQVNANLVINVLLPMVMINLDKLLHNPK